GSVANATSAVDIFTFLAGATAHGVVINSAGNAVVAVQGGTGDRLDEIVIDTGLIVAVDGTVPLEAPPRAVAIDGRHSSYTFTHADGLLQQIEPDPVLADRVQPLLIDRACQSCHNESSTVPVMDFDEAADSLAALVGVPRECSGGPDFSLRVNAGDSA